ncbi:MAG TPA: hypothetical protein VIH24_07390 [Candidatus Limnocylindria bacterium]
MPFMIESITFASRWANAVASTGTRAMAPPSTRSCTMDPAGPAVSASTTASTAASSSDGMNSERIVLAWGVPASAVNS